MGGNSCAPYRSVEGKVSVVIFPGPEDFKGALDVRQKCNRISMNDLFFCLFTCFLSSGFPLHSLVYIHTIRILYITILTDIQIYPDNAFIDAILDECSNFIDVSDLPACNRFGLPTFSNRNNTPFYTHIYFFFK